MREVSTLSSMANTTPGSNLRPAAKKSWREIVYFDAEGQPLVYGDGRWPKNGEPLIRDIVFNTPSMPIDIINLQLRSTRVPLPVRKTKEGKDIVERTRIMPFEVFQAAAEYAARLLTRPMDNPDHMTYQIRGLVAAPPEGDCGGKQSFTIKDWDPAHRWETCCYINCPRHPAPQVRTADNVTYPAVKHSIFMAQHFIRTNGNPLAVKRYVEDFDTRYPVVALAYRHIEVLEQHKIERMGIPQASQRRRATAVG